MRINLILIMISLLTQTAYAEYGLGLIQGTKKVIAVMLESSSAKLPCSKSQIIALLTGSKNNSLKKLYAKASYNNIALTIETYGIYTINSTCENPTQLKAEADQTLLLNGIDISNYDHVIYLAKGFGSCISNGSYDTPALALSLVYTNKKTKECISPITHEFGHGLGLNHSTTASDDYGDISDVMGDYTPALYMNAAHAIQTGWIPESKMVKISASGDYLLSAIEQKPSSAPHPQVYRIATSDPEIDYYISFRAEQGFLQDTKTRRKQSQAMFNRTHVHQIRYSSKSPFPYPRLLTERRAMLKDKKGYTIPELGIVVKQLSHKKRFSKIRITIP